MSEIPLILSVAANVVIAGVGYLGVRQQNITARRGIKAQGERDAQARLEEHLRHRQSLYHNYLDVLRELTALVVVDGTLKELLRWRAQYDHALNAVVVLGADPVRGAVDAMHELVMRFTQDAAGNELRTDKAIRERFQELGPDMGVLFKAIVTAMRLDVAPDRDSDALRVGGSASPVTASGSEAPGLR